MKSLKPIILVLAGVLIVGAMFAFKAEEPKKEYATINYSENVRKGGVVISFATESKTISPETISNESTLIKALNDLAQEGWTVISTENCPPPSTVATFNVRRIIYLERIK